MRTFDMVVRAYLGDLTIEQPQHGSLVPGRETLYLIDSPHSSSENLLQISFVQVHIQKFFDAHTFDKLLRKYFHLATWFYNC